MRTRPTLRTLAAFAAIVFAAVAASADMVQLADGRFVEGVPLQVDGTTLVVKYQNGDVKVPLSMVETYFIEGQAPPVPETEEAKAKVAQGLVPWKGKWVKPADRDKAMRKEIEARQTELAEAKKHGEWRNRYIFSSKHFEFESTLPPSMNEHYSRLLDAYFEVFKKDWSINVPKDWGRLRVCIYPTREDFHKIGGVSGGVLAYYRFVPPRDLNFYNERTDRRMTETVMFHECNHYLVDLFGQGLRYPHWIGEAMAEYYGASTYDPKTRTVKFGQIQEGRLAEVKSDIDAGKTFTLKQYIEEGEHYEDYYWGWSFVHFMMSTPAYQKKFKQFFVDLARAKDVKRTPWSGGAGFVDVSNEECARVFKDRMGIKDYEALEKEWHAYVEKLEAPGVRGFEEAGKRAYREGRTKFRAPRLLKEAVDRGTRDPETLVSYARCLNQKGENEAAVATVDKAIEIDPLDADLWAQRGFLLRAMGDKDGAEKMLALAREMNPDGDYFDIGAVLSQGGGDDD